MRMRSCSIHVLAAFAGSALIALTPVAAQTPAPNPAQAPATSPAPAAPQAPGAEAPVVRDLSQKKAIDLLAAIESLLTRAANERSSTVVA